MITSIEDLPNLGPKSTAWLTDAGIHTVEQLRDLGPVLAYRAVKVQQPRASLNLLWALAAGLDGKDFRQLDPSTKQRLRAQLDELDA